MNFIEFLQSMPKIVDGAFTSINTVLKNIFPDNAEMEKNQIEGKIKLEEIASDLQKKVEEFKNLGTQAYYELEKQKLLAENKVLELTNDLKKAVIATRAGQCAIYGFGGMLLIIYAISYFSALMCYNITPPAAPLPLEILVGSLLGVNLVLNRSK